MAQLIRAQIRKICWWRAARAVPQSDRDYAPSEVVRSLPFWTMYAMFVMVGVGGLMAQAQLAPMAKDFGIVNTPVTFLF